MVAQAAWNLKQLLSLSLQIESTLQPIATTPPADVGEQAQKQKGLDNLLQRRLLALGFQRRGWFYPLVLLS